ncbi:Coiled-coil domain containing 124 family protein [Toxoplasma gondii TgCatPRC2]|uniref:Coiled-coil domain containing 124 family protein n=4 Tax=Toxoplasma gondii TaxID=5811 RepID=A0A151HES0_TOXGO|nr:Coiled-coil domain containing 124 family protein [Toxoplasma gondii ME49]EPT26602.1 Coiled-coil domain containing 124 family protein [Toxoplasma gondii ME49]KFG35780.1 Coiled-coil domain containing 124 family protein [Toxoplasma gondii GAB2-2007-GAL-DOM2]KYF43015.1 Coiled-coil domain containing 124 family protein [Toxoplasma gondii ARI]KYK67855.1 Coiled-coil domain containing 124 family protein [Toxoplasma gondii TgCatPRC2]|eukprot:XP_018635765.1 Coiled-coil domain containing 124 family protein [Toxoplasma gondii ME49]
MAPSTNQRAVEARERKAAAAAEAARIKLEEAERKSWEDNDKALARKAERKATAQQKAEERLQHKAELRRLAAEEDAAAARNTQKKASPPKLTRAQIQQRALLAAAQKKKAAEAETKGVPVDGDIQPNINHILRQQTLEAREAGIEFATATSIDEALAAMSLSEGADRHPERRVKAAYKAYEEIWLPRLKAENPSLKRSQLIEMLSKQWRKAPENPMNQAALAAASSPTAIP